MYDIFECEKAQIYYNKDKKSLEEIKKETGCTHIINGYLFNNKFKPVEWCVVDGKVISKSQYNDYGMSIVNNVPKFTAERNDNFISGIPILVNGNYAYRNLTSDVARAAQRTAVGWTKEGKVILSCFTGTLSVDQLQVVMLVLGAVNCLMMDGGGSTQCIFPSGKIYSSRKIPTVICFWKKSNKGENNTSVEKESMDMVSVNVYNTSTEGSTKITNNFKVSEFKSSDSKIVLIHHTLPIALQMIREKINKPINITNAYRTEAHNTRVGGASNSYHLYGMAADIYVNGMTPKELAKVIDSLFPTTYGCICYTKKNFVHFDVRAKKYRAINDGTEKSVTNF